MSSIRLMVICCVILIGGIPAVFLGLLFKIPCPFFVGSVVGLLMAIFVSGSIYRRVVHFLHRHSTPRGH